MRRRGNWLDATIEIRITLKLEGFVMYLFVRLLPILAFASAIIAPSASFAAVRHCGGLFSDSTATVAGQQTTSSQTFVNLPGAAINFDNSGDCVIVHFSAQARAKLPEKVRIRAILDGEEVAFPLVEWSTPTNEDDGRSATFLFPNVSVAPHTVRIQFLSVEGGTVAISRGLLSIRYSPIE
jgi:hypothetical protein